MLKTLKSIKKKIFCILQLRTDLRKGCVPWNFMQVEFYVSWNFPKFNVIQFFCLMMHRKNYKTVL